MQELTKKSGLAQAELARRAGLSRDTFNRYHSGRPPSDKLNALAELFSVHPNDIDEERLTLRKRSDTISDEPYRVGKSSNGTPNLAHLTLNVDVHISDMSRILEIVTKALKKSAP
ncbi:helix-turn-helix domain-containing protein [Sulfitobacter sp.]|uniref:helix-turn-helix domain-containing protein n=1 Tax=Sulfitobacter sp. TaxID=1903071 RepID=UPI0030024DC3